MLSLCARLRVSGASRAIRLSHLASTDAGSGAYAGSGVGGGMPGNHGLAPAAAAVVAAADDDAAAVVFVGTICFCRCWSCTTMVLPTNPTSALPPPTTGLPLPPLPPTPPRDPPTTPRECAADIDADADADADAEEPPLLSSAMIRDPRWCEFLRSARGVFGTAPAGGGGEGAQKRGRGRETLFGRSG